MFHFGILEALLSVWLLWPILGVAAVAAVVIVVRSIIRLLTVDSWDLDDRDGLNPFLTLGIGGLLATATIHFGGLVDVVSFLSHHWGMVILGAVGYFLLGLGYMVIRGAKRLVRIRAERVRELAKARSDFIRDRRHDLREKFDAAAAEKEADEAIRNDKRSRPVSVNDYKELMMAWAILWLPDLLYHTVFEFFDRLRDLWNILWHFMKGRLQVWVNRYWGNLAEDVQKHAAGEHDRA